MSYSPYEPGPPVDTCTLCEVEVYVDDGEGMCAEENHPSMLVVEGDLLCQACWEKLENKGGKEHDNQNLEAG